MKPDRPADASTAGRGAAAPLVIHCSDPRFQPHFQDFLRAELGIEHYALIAVPGGAQFLTLVDYLPKFSWAGWRWVKFIQGLNEPTRVILIAHEDCRWYLDMRFGAASQDPRAKQVRDLQKARAGLAERFGSIAIELYYARLADGRIVLERL